MNKKQAQEFETALKFARQANSKIYLTLGQGLADLEKTNTWQIFGEHIEDMKTFGKEYGYKVGTLKDFINVYNTFGKYLGEELPAFRRLKQALPHAKGKEKKWIDKALNLTMLDYNDEIRVAKGKPRQADCEHKEVKVITQCKKCGKVLGVKIEPLE